MEYLKSLRSLDQPSVDAVGRLAKELDELIASAETKHVRSLVLQGPMPEGNLSYRDVVLRPLNEEETGAFHEDELRFMGGAGAERPSLLPIVPISFAFFHPTAVLEVTTRRPMGEPADDSSLMHRVTLALLLSDVPLSGLGVVTGTEMPRWASPGKTQGAFPIHQRMLHGTVAINERQFRDMVDLACKIPDFTGAEKTRKQVALFRCLKGCGVEWRESGLLDLAVCLEAALLPKVQHELGFKFALFGSLFLKGERDPAKTYEELSKVYGARSQFVHGDPIAATDLRNAESLARDLAMAVIRRAVTNGWPNPSELTKLAHK